MGANLFVTMVVEVYFHVHVMSPNSVEGNDIRERGQNISSLTWFGSIPNLKSCTGSTPTPVSSTVNHINWKKQNALKMSHSLRSLNQVLASLRNLFTVVAMEARVHAPVPWFNWKSFQREAVQKGESKQGCVVIGHPIDTLYISRFPSRLFSYRISPVNNVINLN